MSFNRWADQAIDALNPRTASRHLPAGRLTSRSVLIFTGVCVFGFIASCGLFLPSNPIPILCSVPVLAFLCGYSYAKRFTIAAHFWLGAALMLAPIAAWVAVLPEFSWAPILLGAAVLFWAAGFDIIYACQDHEFDVKMRLKSVPAFFGVVGSLRIAAGCHVLTLVLLFLLPTVYPKFGPIYYGGVTLIALLLIFEHLLIRPKRQGESIDLGRVNLAFFHLNAIISLGLLLIGVVDLIW